MTYRIFKNRLKKAYKSTTIWFNTVGIALLTAIILEPTFIEYMSDRNLSCVLVVGNIILRFKTNSDLAEK